MGGGQSLALVVDLAVVSQSQAVPVWPLSRGLVLYQAQWAVLLSPLPASQSQKGRSVELWLWRDVLGAGGQPPAQAHSCAPQF